MTEGWTLSELVEQVSAALDADAVRAPNGRIRDLPDARAIRWYATIGLVDRPLPGSGRTARYGSRHLLQLVAIKRRQAQGRSLAQIQTELAGATDDILRGVARLSGDPTPGAMVSPGVAGDDRPVVPAGEVPPDVLVRPNAVSRPRSATRQDPAAPRAAAAPRTENDQESAAPQAAAVPRTENGQGAAAAPGAGERARFWAAAPAAADPPDEPAMIRMRPARRRPAQPPSDVPALTVRYQIDLPGGATLGLPYRPAPDDLAAIGELAAPLVAMLAERGLLASIPPHLVLRPPAAPAPTRHEGDSA